MKEGVEMDNKGKTTSNRYMHATVLTVIGIVVLVLGILIVTVHGAPLRGSGIGTLAIIAGVIVLVIAALRFRSRRALKDGETVKKP
jgi:uncharacterized YccA/Bax inhibitor family protein